METLWEHGKVQMEITCPHCQSGLAVYPGDIVCIGSSFSCICKVCKGKIKIEKCDIPETFLKGEKKNEKK